MEARILVVEDDDDLLAVMAEALAADGHAVQPVRHGDAALDALVEGEHDLVVLDIGLGAGPDGVEVCRRLRRVDTNVYVMVVTARDGEADAVLALEAGADDYVTKPVGIIELRSRVRAALRRHHRVGIKPEPGAADTPPPLVRGSVSLDPAARTVAVDGAPVAMTQSEFAVLEALLRSGGSVLSRQRLLQAIFGDDAYRDPRAIDVHVHHVREKLSAAGADPKAIVTVRGAGYRIDR